MSLTRCLMVFACGATHEILNVAWVHYSERAKPTRAAAVGLVNSAVNLWGIGESILSIYGGAYDVGASYVAGEAIGTWVAIWYLKVFQPTDKADEKGAQHHGD